MDDAVEAPVTERIAIYAALPPPYGGVAVHVERFIAIARERDMPYRVYDQFGKTIPEQHVEPCGNTPLARLKFLLTVREPTIHLHNNGVSTIIAALEICTLRGKKVLLTIHSEKLLRRLEELPVFLRWLMCHSLRQAYHIFAVSDRIARWLVGIGVREESVTVAPAFLPPTAQHLSDDNLSPELVEFLATHPTILGTHGWFGHFVKGVHVYSFDMVLSLAMFLKKHYSESGLYTVVSGTLDGEHRETVLRARRELGLEKDWLIIEKPFHAAALYAKSDLFVRPTITDGDSVSIRECLYLGVPVIASDVVDRPHECILFPTRDTDAMIQCVEHVLSNLEEYRSRLQTSAVGDSSDSILDVYQECLRSRL